MRKCKGDSSGALAVKPEAQGYLRALFVSCSCSRLCTQLFFFALLVRTRLHLLGTGRSKREQNVERKVGNVPGNLKDGGFEAPREPSSQREHLFSRAFIYRGAIAGGFFFFSALLHSVGGPFALETTRTGERERKKRDEKLNK